MSEVQKKFQELSEEYQKLDGELQVAVETRQRLESQLQENITVKEEFDKLARDSDVFKQTGPVLLKQDRDEAILAVNGRLTFIEAEISRRDETIEEIQNKSRAIKAQLFQLQGVMQQQQATQQKSPPA